MMMNKLRDLLHELPITLWVLAAILTYLQVMVVNDIAHNGGLGVFIESADLERVALAFAPLAALAWITRLEAKARFIRRTGEDVSDDGMSV